MTKSIAVASLMTVSLAQPFKAAHVPARASGPAIAAQAATPFTYLETPAGKKPRVVITADPELDDNNSMIRYILMSDGYQTKGLIYASSQFHWKGDGKGTLFSMPNREYNRNGRNVCPCTHWRWNPNERFIDDIVDAYEKAYPNLKIHGKDYPSPTQLRSKVKWGNVNFEGEMDNDTDGSNLIKSLLLDNVNEPIYLHAWGGLSTIARALKSIEEQYKDTPQWAVIRAKVIGKGVIHPSGAQDNTGADYIRPNWPEIRYGNGGGAVGVGLSYNAQSTAADVDKVYYSAEWMRENISSKGTFGTLQRVWGDGKQMEKGAWKDGARRTAEIRPSTRRMTWAITPTYADANHYPIVALKSAKLSGKPGEVVNVSATIRDPDNDRVSVTWWPFENNGTYAGAVTLNTTEGLTTSFRIPADAKPGDTIHIIAEANDDGMRSLTRYARAVVTVK